MEVFFYVIKIWLLDVWFGQCSSLILCILSYRHMFLVVELEIIICWNLNVNAKLITKFDKVVRRHSFMVCNNDGLFPTFTLVLVYNWLKTSSLCRLTFIFVKSKMQFMCVQTTCVISYHPKSNQGTWFVCYEPNGITLITVMQYNISKRCIYSVWLA